MKEEKIMRIASLKAIQAETELKIENMKKDEQVDMKALAEEQESLENLKVKIKRIQDQAIKGQLLI